MMRAQGLPVNMIVLTALALLVLVVVGAFFISGFGSAAGSVNIVNATQADCQSTCQSMVSAAFNYNSCSTFATGNPQYSTENTGYADLCAAQFGACTVTLSDGSRCTCDASSCTAV